MHAPLLTLIVKTKRDALRVRQITRQAAEMLGFDVGTQVALSATAFDLVCTYTGRCKRCSVDWLLSDDCFRVVCASGKGREPAQLSRHLPANSAVPREDVPWMLQQLVDLAPLDVFEEIRKVNHELLAALMELAACRARQRTGQPNAA